MGRLRKYSQLYVMAIPTLVYFAVFSLYPIVQGVYQSTQRARLLGGGVYVGLQNYRTVLADSTFWQAVANTLTLGLGMVATGVVVPLVVAIALHELPFAPLRRLTQTVIYTPHLFSWVVVGGIWIHVLSPDGGLVNEVIKAFGGRPIHFLADTLVVKPVFVLLATWKDMGYNAVIYYAAISSLDPTVYEAATVDGANRWQKTRYITLPQLLPTSAIVLVLSTVSALRMFDQIFILRNAATSRAVNVIMTYVYDKGIIGFRLGEATAASFFVVAVGVVFLAVLRRAMQIDRVELD